MGFYSVNSITSIYEIPTKAFSLRLEEVLNDTTSTNQRAFFGDWEGVEVRRGRERQILDVFLEVVEDIERFKCKAYVFKVDSEKAYSIVNWGFLDKVLSGKGFGNRRLHWNGGHLSLVPYGNY